MGAPPSNSVEIPNVTCPFCGLLCDDLTVTRTGGSLEVTSGPCAIAARGFAGVPAPSAPMARIRGESTTVDAAIAEAARLLSQARQPLLGGLSTDLAGARAAARLADRVGGVVDHMNSAVSLRNLLVLQDGGWVTTTLSEVRNHADLLVIVGSDISRRHPRLVERTVLHRETLYDSERSCRLLLLGVEPGSIELAGARVPV
ncbi:MAG TPA: hypothetical protein VG817_10085, partial [Gemmatimonadales bacterium]|nr:hypothetical protein [Gemmatimonadales bacterium]